MIGPYLIDKVTQRLNKGRDEWQEPLPTEDVTIRVFIDYGEHRIQNAEGQVVVSMAKLYMRPRPIITDPTAYAARADFSISYKDTFIFDGIEHAVMRISKSRDFSVRSMDVYVT